MEKGISVKIGRVTDISFREGDTFSIAIKNDSGGTH